MGWGERFAAFPLAQDGCLWGEEGKQKEKEQNERFFLHKSLCNRLLFGRKIAERRRVQSEEMCAQSGQSGGRRRGLQ